MSTIPAIGMEVSTLNIPMDEVEIYLGYAKSLDEGEPYSPKMMGSLKHPYLKKKLLELVCLRRAR